MKNNKRQLLQLDLFEEFISIEQLEPGDHLRLTPRSADVYVVVEQFYDANPETKFKLVNSRTIYFVKHGRKVLKVYYHAELKL